MEGAGLNPVRPVGQGKGRPGALHPAIRPARAGGYADSAAGSVRARFTSSLFSACR